MLLVINIPGAIVTGYKSRIPLWRDSAALLRVLYILIEIALIHFIDQLPEFISFFQRKRVAFSISGDDIQSFY
jgi:hypothetical protein